MIYICEDCHFLFWSDVETEQCPDCGKTAVRPADEAEQAEYWSYQKEFHPERIAACH
jgi:rRNA maturation endonuclease Nob1